MTTTVNSVEMAIADKNITLADGATSNALQMVVVLQLKLVLMALRLSNSKNWSELRFIREHESCLTKVYKIDNTSVLSATTLGAGVVNSSLEVLGTINTGVWQGTAINDDYIDFIDNANKVKISALDIDAVAEIGT